MNTKDKYCVHLQQHLNIYLSIIQQSLLSKLV